MDNLSVQDLYKGCATVLKNKEFFPTKTYVEPFIERMSAFTDDFRIQTKVANQLSIQEDTNTIYNRVLVQAVMPREHCIDDHDEVMGFLYGLDVRKPVVKIYRSYLNKACTNMCVFDPQWIQVQELVPGDPVNYNGIKNLMEMTSNFGATLEHMKKTYVPRDDRKLHLGNWVDHILRDSEDYGYGKVKLSTGTPIDAYKKLFINQDSEYFVPDGYDPTVFDVYNSFTQILTDDSKDILNKFEKVQIINRLLGVGENN